MDTNTSVFNSPDAVLDQLSGRTIFLYGQEPEWVKPTKINLHYGIWKRLKHTLKVEHNVKQEILLRSTEQFIEDDSGQIMFCGLAEVKPEAYSFALEKLAGESEKVIIFSAEPFDALAHRLTMCFKEALFKTNLYHDLEKYSAFYKTIMEGESIIFPKGAYDDRHYKLLTK